MKPAEVILAALALPVVAATGYLATLSLLSGRTPPPQPGKPHVIFDIVVPAHDEAASIAKTVASLLALDYPKELYSVVVVADNCTDDTAARARAAGARVLERNDPSLRGKGYALAHAFERIVAEARTHAVVVVDADTLVTPNLLRAFAARLDAGASVVQADYAVRNPDPSWRTRLMAVAFATIHTLRSVARERLLLSCGLRGNGMCFTTALLRAVPHDAFSVVEDLEYGIRLGEAGHRVFYADEAHVYGEMPSGERASRTQRDRWEGGRVHMARLHARRLIVSGIVKRDRVLVDLGIDLLIPPLATLVAATTAGLGASAFLSWRAGRVAPVAWIWIGCASGLFVYGLRGWQLSGTGARGLLGIVYIPGYVAWKILLKVRGTSGAPGEWVRTAREGEQAPT